MAVAPVFKINLSYTLINDTDYSYIVDSIEFNGSVHEVSTELSATPFDWPIELHTKGEGEESYTLKKTITATPNGPNFQIRPGG